MSFSAVSFASAHFLSAHFLSAIFPTLAGEVPVTPGADEARRWALEELSKQQYQDAKPGLAQIIRDWLSSAWQQFLDGMGSVNGGASQFLLVGLAIAVILAAIFIVRPQLNRRKATIKEVFEGQLQLSSAEHRELAAAAAARGDMDTAVTEEFRALVRASEERGVCAPAPGRTAVELAAELQRAFPRLSAEVRHAAQTFNVVRYGHSGATEAMYRELLATDDALAAAKPLYADDLTKPSEVL